MGTGLLEGETGLVTGAGSGIGRGIARALAREGARLALSDVDESRGLTIADELGATFVGADLTRPAASNQLFEQTLNALGRVSLLVHSASPPRREAETALAVTPEQWDAMISVNLRSGFLLGQQAGRHMVEQGIAGRMLFIVSLHAETPRNLPHYSAAKAGQVMVMRELAKALGPAGIRVNAIAPGAIPGGGFVADVGSLTPKIALGRTGTPDDVAAMAVALLSDRFSGYVTGTVVAVDGGLSLHNWIDPPA